MKTALLNCCFFIMLVLFAISIAVGVRVLRDYYVCSTYTQVTGKETKYSGLSCYVKYNNSWFTFEEYKYRFAGKGDFK